MLQNPEAFESISTVAQYNALKGLCIYQSPHGAVISMHNIKDGQFDTGRLVSVSDVTQLLASISEPHTDHDFWQDERILYDSPRLLVWSTPAQHRDLWFTHGKTRLRVNAKTPRTLFALHRHLQQSKLFVFACQDKRPTLTTKVYAAPYMNISKSGLLCQGSAVLPDQLHTCRATIDACESSLFDSAFSHTNHNQTFRGSSVRNHDHIAHWQRLSAAKRAPKMTELTPLHFCLSSFIDRLERS